ncbi:hypothetical protein [Inhella proteolytica]|uniref:Uncharacterized protein n=1 Tax=Inhella proteolytica TaxID=2795029 RepID=A0A931J6Y2_9BURK|nr:hypothetical protein [Inhella proteolytica]MBH9579386.1 hypothetical protein [Inhella proteolytica]
MNDLCNSTLRKLWGLTGSDPECASADWNDFFDPIGLILLAPPRNYGYWCTPLNSLTFATTGGDGVHYGLLALDGQFTDFSPVVMTVPMSDTSNTIVGANLKEFLALGIRFGYFGLEQLVYDRHNTMQELELPNFDQEMSQRERSLLNLISSEFNIRPWSRVDQRLKELQAQFAAALQLPPEEESAA